MRYQIKKSFIGLGNIGSPIARKIGANNILQTWDACELTRTKFKNEIKVSNSNFKSINYEYFNFDNIDTIFTCLPNSKIVEQVYEELKNKIKPGTIWVDLTSGNPEQTIKMNNKLRENNIYFVDCAVSGGPAGAEKATLTTMIGCENEETLETIKPYLETFSNNIIHVGKPGSGHAVKAINNALLAINLWSSSEAISTLVKFGITPEKALQAINNSSGRSWVTQQRFPDHILTGTYDYGFSLDLLKKDVDTAKSICQEHSHMQNPTSFLIHKQSELLAKAQDKLEEGADHVEIYKIFE